MGGLEILFPTIGRRKSYDYTASKKLHTSRIICRVKKNSNPVIFAFLVLSISMHMHMNYVHI